MMCAIGYLHVQESGPLWIYHFGWFAVVQAMPCLYDRHLYYIHTVVQIAIIVLVATLIWLYSSRVFRPLTYHVYRLYIYVHASK